MGATSTVTLLSQMVESLPGLENHKFQRILQSLYKRVVLSISTMPF